MYVLTNTIISYNLFNQNVCLQRSYQDLLLAHSVWLIIVTDQQILIEYKL